MNLFVRGQGSADALSAMVRDAIRRLDRALPLAHVSTLERMIGEPIDRPRLLTTIMTVFAGLALSLAALWIYSVMSYGVSQRRQELSVRVALGAERGSIVWLVVRQGLALAAVGIVAGALGGTPSGESCPGCCLG